MTIRASITLLTVPFFLLLALVNGALLYFQDEAEILQALDDQAEAAAVTSAEFLARIDRPAQRLTEPRRAQALSAAADRLPGLDALYLVSAGAKPLALFTPVRPLDPSRYRRPAATQVLPTAGAEGDRHVVALAPAGPGAFVIARIDAEPLFAQLAATRRLALGIVLAAGLIALALAWVVAQRITDELQVSADALADGAPSTRPLAIREARDLADAVRLMQANTAAAAQRDERALARRDRQRSVASAFAAWRQSEFAPIAAHAAGRAVALRIVGAPPLGSFFALCEGHDAAAIVVGRCEATDGSDALASALAARRFLEANMFALPAEECLALAREAYGIAEMHTITWTSETAPDEPPAGPLAFLADEASRHGIAAYAARNPDAAPEDMLDAIAVLLAPDGVFAAVAIS